MTSAVASAHGSNSSFSSFLFAAVRPSRDLVSRVMLGLNHLMASSHTPSGRGRFDVLQNSSRILASQFANNGSHEWGSAVKQIDQKRWGYGNRSGRI